MSMYKNIFVLFILVSFTKAIFAFDPSGFSSSQYANDLFEKAQASGFSTHLDQQTKTISTQLEFLVLTSRLLQLTNELVTSSTSINSKVDIPDWAKQAYVIFESKFGPVSPYYFTEFSAKKPILKEQAAKIVYNYLFADPDYSNNVLTQNQLALVEKNATQQLKIIGLWPKNSNLSSPYLSKEEVTHLWLQAAAYKHILHEQAKKKIAQAQAQSLDKLTKKWFENWHPTIGGSLDLSTHYVTRGTKQIDQSSVHLLGGMQAVFKQGAYIATQLSPVQYRIPGNQAPNNPIASYEVLAMCGQYLTFLIKNKPILMNIGALHTSYPDVKKNMKLDYSELFVSTKINTITASFYVLAHAQDSNFSFMDDYYASISTQHNLFQDLTLNVSLGFYKAKFAAQQLGTNKKTNLVLSLQKNNLTLAGIFTDHKQDDPIIQLTYKLVQF